MASLFVGIAGFVVVLLIVFGLIGAARLLQKLQYRLEYHDYTFEPLTPIMLPHRASHHFEEHTPRFESLGFERIGDFQLHPTPCPAFARYFVSRDGSVFGGLDDYEGMRTYSFFSVLEDGTYLETGKSRPIVQPRGNVDKMRFVYVPDASLDEVYKRHLKSLGRLEQKHGPALNYDTDQFREVVSYGHKLVHWSAYRQGMPYAPPVSDPVETLGA